MKVKINQVQVLEGFDMFERPVGRWDWMVSVTVGDNQYDSVYTSQYGLPVLETAQEALKDMQRVLELLEKQEQLR